MSPFFLRFRQLANEHGFEPLIVAFPVALQVNADRAGAPAQWGPADWIAEAGRASVLLGFEQQRSEAALQPAQLDLGDHGQRVDPAL